MGNGFGFPYQCENKTDKEKNQVTTSAGKEDNTDSTVTKTTAVFTSVCESTWDDCITEGLCSRNNNIERSDLCLWKRRWIKPVRKWKTPTPQVCRKKHSSPTLGTVGHGQAQTINGVFVFGCAPKKATKTKSHWPYYKTYQVAKILSDTERKLPRNQDADQYLENSRYVDSNKTQKTSATGDAVRKQREHSTKLRIADPYIRDAQPGTENGRE